MPNEDEGGRRCCFGLIPCPKSKTKKKVNQRNEAQVKNKENLFFTEFKVRDDNNSLHHSSYFSMIPYWFYIFCSVFEASKSTSFLSKQFKKEITDFKSRSSNFYSSKDYNMICDLKE